jgi:Leucine-rich repeat (LRR) protein
MRLLTNLLELNIERCWKIEDWRGLCELVSLQKLNVSGIEITELRDLRKLKQLQFLVVSVCDEL